ncbi:hypothetical protein QR721_10810 [Aciduricibacillus chroicocephali]|uniref:Type 4 fimbrial biogenesis protein PilX N-terminal domain-containing protein n=1 Tax=Aciduricibacillus chroicocephali TaxID=3054939 RepID=A0ABY9KUC2_9BACI|nr:hypothetical protein QR721_10810 [Bacillaceae bacterium 44XB]
MKRLKNEHGAALVVVLGIIMLLMIFATVLAAQMTNTQKQIQLTDQAIDARNLARMGLDRAGEKVSDAFRLYEQDLEANITRKDKKTQEQMRNEFYANIENIQSPLISLDETHFYQIKSTIIDRNTWQVTVTALGVSKSKEKSKEITEISKIEIEKPDSAQ